MRIALKRNPDTLCVVIAGKPVSVPVRTSSRARRIILKIDTRTGGPALTIPEGTPTRAARSFLAEQTGWIARHMASRPAATAFAEGCSVPLRGVPHTIRHRAGGGLVRAVAGAERAIVVPGEPNHLSRRLHAWLRREARKDLEPAVFDCARALGVRHRALRIGDPTSRWGSCSARRTLSFSWRLIMAPPGVLSYLVAHEVAHLREMNHGPRFWRLVAELDPDHERARTWLTANGPGLHAIGRARVSPDGDVSFCRDQTDE